MQNFMQPNNQYSLLFEDPGPNPYLLSFIPQAVQLPPPLLQLRPLDRHLVQKAMNIIITTSRAWEIAFGVVSPGFSTILSGIANLVKLIKLSSEISRYGIYPLSLLLPSL